MKISFTLLLLFAIGVSCSKNDDDDCGAPAQAKSENFLESMSVGDKFYYSLLLGENYFEGSESEYYYTGDTLELEVLQVTTAGTVISQKITDGSQMVSNPDFYYWQRDSVYVNTWKIEGDSLFIESDGPYYSNHLLSNSRLKFSDYTEQEVEIIGCCTSYDHSEQNAQLYATNYTLFGHNYDSLSVYIYNEPMSYDGNGSTAVYSKSHGVVRASTYGSWSPIVYGWDRIW